MNNSQRLRYSRRRFLDTLSKAGVAGAVLPPLLGGLFYSRHARAAGEVKRAVFVYTPDGAPNGLWLPDGGSMNLATEAYAGLEHLINFREVEVVGSGHGLARKSLGALRWSQDWTSDTIDQQIASVLSVDTPFPSYMLGVQANPQEGVSRQSGASVPIQNSPAAAYQQLFGAAPPAADASEFLTKKRAVMDINQAALNELKSKLGAFERTTFEKHADALTALEDRLAASLSGERPEGCDSPSWNQNGYDPQGPTESDVGVFRHQADLQSDITVAAFQCGVTNVMTLQLGWHQAVWYGHDTSFTGDHHNSCHGASAEANAEMTNYLSGCVAYLISRLASEDDPMVPGTKLIDNTVVVQVTDMGDGQDHSGANGPNLVATGMSGFTQGSASRGGTNLQLLETVANGLGLGAYIGTDSGAHKIWPAGDGTLLEDLLA